MAVTHVVVGTAGHIDHGKSALVLALTGTDPDRLKEEKARGITIDLGFAHWDTPGVGVSFVDVPGHERFVKNMLAGAGGIDLVMLVVAADESVMPQTREHFEICRLLHVPAGLIVLTKADLVDADMVELVKLEVRDLVKGSFLDRAPMIAASSKTGAGLEDVRAAITAHAAHAGSRSSDGLVRLPVDRVFSMRGFGTVVTGTLVSGRLRADAEAVLEPGGRPVKIRGLQVHGAVTSDVSAGQRVAVNVSGVEVADVQRGDVLVTPGTLQGSRVIDTRVEVLPGAKPMRHGARVRFHQGAAEVIGRLAISEILDGDGPGGAAGAVDIGGGQRAYVRIRLERPAVVTRGDRFILRAYSPPVTLAGGVVIDPQPPRGGIRTVAGRRRFAALDPGRWTAGQQDTADVQTAATLINESGVAGLPSAALAMRLGLGSGRAAHVRQWLERDRVAEVVGESLVSVATLEERAAALGPMLARYHAAAPLADGMPREEARERLCGHAAPGVFERVLERLVATRAIVARDRLALSTHTLALSPEEAEARDGLERVYREAALSPPSLGDAAASLHVALPVAEKVVALLVRQKVLARVDTLIFHVSALAGLKGQLSALKAAAGTEGVRLDVPAFKERFGVTRKYAIPLLEYLDRERITRRVGDTRALV
jgi:selenocysteine-specific elongation factor